MLRLFATQADLIPTLVRVARAAGNWPHGAQKVLGWFGGFGLEKTVGFFSQSGMPVPLALAIIAAEFLGPIALLFGVGGRLAAFGIAAVMVVAAVTVHLPNGFFMNWSGAAAGEGFEYHILAFVLALVVVLRGSGALSVDGWLVRG
jgi:putative oxidoreductase